MDVQTEKELVIERFRQIDDEDLIRAIKSMLDYALKNAPKVYQVSEEQQKLVMDRFEQVRQEPDRLLDWDDAKKSLKS